MKQMNVKVFLDTNILVYTYSDTEPDKQATSRKLITGCNILYSEDMHHGQIVDNRLRITNPFI